MTITCPPHQYEHSGQCCDHCPQGKYVGSHCSNSSATTCKTCPHGSYMGEKNGLTQCMSCKSCDKNQNELKACQEHSDRQCKCVYGFYCSAVSNNHCDHCLPVKTCPPGEGVSTQHTSIKDTICSPCTAGTFSSVEDYKTPCHNHTNCEMLGRHLLTAGTASTDAKCGDFVTYCPWMVPAGLWAGLIMTILICGVIALLYRRAKLRSQQTVSSSACPECHISPVLPPDIIKHPRSPELQTVFQTDELFSNTNCSLESEVILMNTMTASEKYGHSADMYQYGGFPTSDPSLLQSEPQEDEWTGA